MNDSLGTGRRRYSVMVLLPLALMVSGCGVLKPTDTADKPRLSQSAREALFSNHRQRVSQIQYWRAKGKIAVSSPQDSGSAQINWWQVRSAFDIRLNGPLGAGAVRLKSDSTGALLISSPTEQVRGDTADELLQSAFGWRIPLQSLSEWMLGLPGSAETIEIDDQGRLSKLEHAGWLVDFEAYSKIDPITHLPRLIELENGDYRVKVAITSWDDQSPTLSNATLINTPVKPAAAVEAAQKKAVQAKGSTSKKASEGAKTGTSRFSIPGVD